MASDIHPYTYIYPYIYVFLYVTDTSVLTRRLSSSLVLNIMLAVEVRCVNPGSPDLGNEIAKDSSAHSWLVVVQNLAFDFSIPVLT